MTKTSLKSSQGPDEWLDFFKIVSSLFAIKEELPVLEEYKERSMEDLMIECFNLTKELKVLDTSEFISALEKINENCKRLKLVK